MEDEIVLHIYKAFSGQYAGRIYKESEEIGSIFGCENEIEVYESIQEMYDVRIDFVVDGHSGQSLTDLISIQKRAKGD